MALAVSDRGPAVALTGGRQLRTVELVADGDYAAGGYDLTAETLGLAALTILVLGSASGFVPEYDYDNGKVKFNVAGAEAADGADDLDRVAFRGLAIGRP